MSLNVPSEITARITGANTEIVDHETFVGICLESLPGAVKMYGLLREGLASSEDRAYKRCFHGFTDVERGHVVRACYGDAINRELNAHFGLTLVRVAPGRVAGFRPEAAACPDFRRRVFALSAQRAHEGDAVEAPAIIDQPDTRREIERLYPLAYARIAAHGGRPFTDLDSKKDPELFRQTVEMLSIRPYRFLLEDAFGSLVTVNCCGSAGRGKKEDKRPEKGEREEDQAPEELGPMIAFIPTRTFQLQMQEPYLLDC